MGCSNQGSSTEMDALSDLIRTPEVLRRDLLRVRHRPGKLLLRHDALYEDTNMTKYHPAGRMTDALRTQDAWGSPATRRERC
jgi:hypothetical protein